MKKTASSTTILSIGRVNTNQIQNKMKAYNKIVLSLLAFALLLPASAQKKKFYAGDYLPREGDFGLTVSANPFTSFVGNLFNNSTSNELNSFGGSAYFSPILSISGKYLLTDHLAVRANLGWSYNSARTRYYTQDDAALLVNPFSQKQVIDEHIVRRAGGSFSVAAEYRIGNRRVQGIVGGGLVYAFSTNKERFVYGNGMTEINQNPSSTGMAAQVDYRPYETAPAFSSQRYLTSFSSKPTHHFGPYAFVGVEWFICPWISLGGEVNVSAAWNWTGATYYESEGFNTISGKVENWTQMRSPSSSGFNFGTGNFGANITVSFYFNRNTPYSKIAEEVAE